MTPGQLRAARALINMSHAELAGAAVVPIPIIADYEAGVGPARPADLEAIKGALERAGIEFIDGERPGVRLRDAI